MTDQPKLLRWVKASDRLPKDGERVITRWSAEHGGGPYIEIFDKKDIEGWENAGYFKAASLSDIEWLEEYTEPERPDQPQAEVPDKFHPVEVTMLDLIEEKHRLKIELFKIKNQLAESQEATTGALKLAERHEKEAAELRKGMTKKSAFEKSEELWDEYSKHIGSDIDDLIEVAGTSILSKSDYYRLVRDLILDIYQPLPPKSYGDQTPQP